MISLRDGPSIHNVRIAANTVTKATNPRFLHYKKFYRLIITHCLIDFFVRLSFIIFFFFSGFSSTNKKPGVKLYDEVAFDVMKRNYVLKKFLRVIIQ